MKKLLFIFAVLMAVSLTARAADGDSFTIDGLQYSVTSEAAHEVTLTKCVKESKTITIPQTVSNNGTDYDVTAIGESAFSRCSMVSIAIPESVSSIGSSAFYNCKELSSISLPESVESIGTYAFAICQSLTSLVIPCSLVRGW